MTNELNTKPLENLQKKTMEEIAACTKSLSMRNPYDFSKGRYHIFVNDVAEALPILREFIYGRMRAKYQNTEEPLIKISAVNPVKITMFMQNSVDRGFFDDLKFELEKYITQLGKSWKVEIPQRGDKI